MVKGKKYQNVFFSKPWYFIPTKIPKCMFVCLYVSNFPSPPKKMCFVNRSNYLSEINKLPNTIPPPLLVFFWYFAHRYSLGILAIFVRLWVGRVGKFIYSWSHGEMCSIKSPQGTLTPTNLQEEVMFIRAKMLRLCLPLIPFMLRPFEAFISSIIIFLNTLCLIPSFLPP